jgi:membrane fusion protein, multidrug efflux system
MVPTLGKSQIKTYLYILLSIIIFSCGKRQQKPIPSIQAEEIIAVKTEAVQMAGSNNNIETAGVLMSLSEARLAFKTGGIIQKIYVKEGQNVVKGQLLASLNLTEINASVQQAAEAVQKAERDLKRAQNLLTDSIATLEQVQNLSTALAIAKQNLQVAQYNHSYSLIHAPFGGTIVKKLMNEGELCGPGSPAFYLVASGAQHWALKVGLTDQEWASLKTSQPATVQLDAHPNIKFTGHIYSLGMAPDASSGQYHAEIKLNTQNKKMVTGLFGKAKIPITQTKSLASISINSMVEGHGKQAFVYTISPQNTAVKHSITIDHIEQNRVFLTEIPNIKSVITDGAAYLVEGAKVKVINP